MTFSARGRRSGNVCLFIEASLEWDGLGSSCWMTGENFCVPESAEVGAGLEGEAVDRADGFDGGDGYSGLRAECGAKSDPDSRV